MEYKIGAKIISKKPHACKNNEWEITRIGADIKLRCTKCQKSIFVSFDEAVRLTKKYIDLEG